MAATRGRRSNHLYIDTWYDPDPQTGHDGAVIPETGREALAGVLRNEGADVAAYEAIRRAQSGAESIATLAAEYQTIAAKAQDDRWNRLLARSGLTTDQITSAKESPAYGPLTSALREAESRRANVEQVFPALVRGRTLVNADDVAAVLHSRVDAWIKQSRTRPVANDDLVAGLFPRAQGMTDPDLKRGLLDREEAIEIRAVNLALQAIRDREPWTAKLGQPPKDPARRTEWLGAAATIAAYRERWEIGSEPRPLGSPKNVKTLDQHNQHKRALSATRQAVELARHPRWGVSDPFSFAVSTPAPQWEHERGIEL